MIGKDVQDLTAQEQRKVCKVSPIERYIKQLQLPTVTVIVADAASIECCDQSGGATAGIDGVRSAYFAKTLRDLDPIDQASVVQVVEYQLHQQVLVS